MAKASSEMGKKRGTGEGTVFCRKDGIWVGRLSLGFDQSGKRQQRTVYGKTQREVNEKLDDLKQQRKHGAKAVVGKDTVDAYLQRWLEGEVALNKSGKTHQEYEGAVRLYITPFIGKYKLTRLDGDILSSWQGTLARKNFSNNMRSRAIKVLRAALTRAVKLRLIPFNPCVVLTKPKVSPKEVIPLEPEQCRKLITACQKHRLGDMITLAAITGLRKGELFALNWSAVNLSEDVLVVRRTLQEINGLSLKEPKTKAGKRIVSLGTEALDALKSRLAKALDEGFEPDEVPIVFPNIRGGYMRGSNFDRNVWSPIREAAGIPETFVFHDLRHTQASLMLAAGVVLKVIQKRLGHRDFSTTANTYSHLLQNAENEAVSRVGDLMNKRAPKPMPEAGEYSR